MAGLARKPGTVQGIPPGADEGVVARSENEVQGVQGHSFSVPPFSVCRGARWVPRRCRHAAPRPDPHQGSLPVPQ